MVNYTGYDFGAVTSPADETKAKELVIKMIGWDQHPNITLYARDVINMMIDVGMISKETAQELMRVKEYQFPTLPTPHI